MGMNKPYRAPTELPDELPLFPLTGAILLPGGQLPLNIFEPRYLAMFDDAMRAERIIGLIQPRDDRDGAPGETPPLRPIGAAGRITQMSETGDGRYFVVLSGIARFRLVEELPVEAPYRRARVDFSEFSDDFAPEETISPERRDGTQRHRLRPRQGVETRHRPQGHRGHAGFRHDLRVLDDRPVQPLGKAGAARNHGPDGPRRPAARAGGNRPVARHPFRSPPAIGF